MPISNTSRVEDNVLIITTSGTFASLEELTTNTGETVSLVKETGCTRVLADCRQIEGNLDTIGLFKLASSDAEAWIPANRFALVLQPEHRDDSQFYENVAYNRGHKLRVFYDYDAALAWIKE